MKKTIRWTLLIASIAIIVFVTMFIYNGRYVWNYFSAVGVREGMTMEQLERRLGEPNDIYFRCYRIALARYDGINFVFPVGSTGTISTLFGVEIVGSEIRLGRHRIGVGSTREEIFRAYDRRNTWVGIVDGSDGRILRANDGKIWWIHFYMDENDIVEKIYIQTHSPI